MFTLELPAVLKDKQLQILEKISLYMNGIEWLDVFETKGKKCYALEGEIGETLLSEILPSYRESDEKLLELK